jgi:lipopolysaccharide transport system ATP-binding protein
LTTARTAIRAHGLTKRYPITLDDRTIAGDGLPVAGYGTIREELASWMKGMIGRRAGRRREWVTALDDVSFEIAEGSVVGLVGRNGAGKTTLLKVLARITEPTAGMGEIRGRVGSLLEVGTGFHPELTGRENVYLSGAILGMRRSEIVRRFDEIIGFAEIERFVDTPLKRFSSGMYLRLAFAVAAHLETEILLVDEVLAVGDLHFRRRCLGKMREVGSSGRTVVYVSHDLNSVRQLCDRALWLDRGSLVEDGAVGVVTAHYEADASGGLDSSGGVSHRDPASVIGRAVWFDRIELRRANGETTTAFRWGDAATVVMSLAGRAPADAFTIEWTITNERGERVSVGTANPQQDVYFDRHDRVIECVIDPLWLTSGTYRLSVSILVWNQIRWDTWTDAATFRVIQADAFRTGFDSDAQRYGVVVLPHRWRSIERS